MPDLYRYQYKLSDKQDNLQNVVSSLRSEVYGGSVLGTKNPLKEKIRRMRPNKMKNGGYYVLRNVQK